jgi:hypothetical protein
METRCKRIALEDCGFIEKATNYQRPGRPNGPPNNPETNELEADGYCHEKMDI